jgi:hypothetical protein
LRRSAGASGIARTTRAEIVPGTARNPGTLTPPPTGCVSQTGGLLLSLRHDYVAAARRTCPVWLHVVRASSLYASSHLF